MNAKTDRRSGLFRKIIIGLLLISAVAVFKFFDLGQYISLSFIKASQARFELLYAEHRLMVILGYAGIYILATSLSLPGATVLTLAGGALFGLWIGTLTVSIASTIGATLACMVSRFILRDWVQTKFEDRLKTVNEGIAREGAFYLFTLRLVPLLPFWLINLVMGLTKMPLRKYFLVSQAGMLPATIVYVNAGRELAKLDSVSGVLSPGLIISFALLGLLPLIIRKGLALYKGGKHVSP